MTQLKKPQKQEQTDLAPETVVDPTRFTTLILGPPKTGKSTAASGVCNVVDRTLLLACKGRETRSFGYVRQRAQDRLDTEIYEDHRWAPSLGRYEADAFQRMLKRLDNLYMDDIYDAVVIDPFTDFAISITHEILKTAGVGSPGEMEDTYGFYSELKDKADETVRLACGLSTHAKRPKHVIVLMHVQPPKDDTVIKGMVKPSADKVARGVEYEGTVLPMIDGAYRRKMAGDFDIVVYTGFEESFNSKTRKKEGRYYLQVSPDRDRHSAIAVAPALVDSQIDNDFSKLLKVIREEA